MAKKNNKPIKIISKSNFLGALLLLSLFLTMLNLKVFGGFFLFVFGFTFGFNGYAAFKTEKILGWATAPSQLIAFKFNKSDKSEKFGAYLVILIGVILSLLGLVAIFANF